MIGDLSGEETARGFLYLARTELEYLALQRGNNASHVASGVVARLNASAGRPNLTHERAADTATAVNQLAGDVETLRAGKGVRRRFGEGFDGNPQRALEAYKWAVIALAEELSEDWGVSGEETMQRLALELAREAAGSSS